MDEATLNQLKNIEQDKRLTDLEREVKEVADVASEQNELLRRDMKKAIEISEFNMKSEINKQKSSLEVVKEEPKVAKPSLLAEIINTIKNYDKSGK